MTEDHDLKYLLLWNTLRDAWEQAANGKGKDRHQKDDEPFEDQPICMFARRVGLGYPLGQAMKKIDEAARMEPEAAVHELLGAINYLAAAVIVLRENCTDKEQPMITGKIRLDKDGCIAGIGVTVNDPELRSILGEK